MKLILPLISLALLVGSCQQSQRTKDFKDNVKIVDTISKLSEAKTSSSNFDTSKMSMTERINKLIELSTIKRFKQSRKELIELGTPFHYQISEIQEVGNSYNFKVSVPNIDIEMIYSCFPKDGNYTVYMAGEVEAIKSQYDQVKVQQDWDDCNKIEEGERCESDKQIEPYPVKTHFKISITYVGYKKAIFNYQRKLRPSK